MLQEALWCNNNKSNRISSWIEVILRCFWINNSIVNIEYQNRRGSISFDTVWRWFPRENPYLTFSSNFIVNLFILIQLFPLIFKHHTSGMSFVGMTHIFLIESCVIYRCQRNSIYRTMETKELLQFSNMFVQFC